MLAATLEVLAVDGWEGFAVEAVAERAGVHKTTIYRRWSTRGALVAAALAATPFRAHGNEAPDTGTVRSDLLALVADNEAVLAHPRTRRIMAALKAGHPDVAAARRHFHEHRHGVIATLIQRGVARGELDPSTDVALAATMFNGAVTLEVWERGIDPPHEWFVDLVDRFLRAFAVT